MRWQLIVFVASLPVISAQVADAQNTPAPTCELACRVNPFTAPAGCDCDAPGGQAVTPAPVDSVSQVDPVPPIFARGDIPQEKGDTPQDSTAYCDRLCKIPLHARIIPRDPPFECDCTVLIEGGGSGGGNGRPMTAAEILDRMWASYEQRVAGITDYTVVQTTSSAPLPVVLYYEKEVTDGHSTFQLISPAELADREAAATGQPTSQEIGGGVVALADMLAGFAGGGSPPSSADASADDASPPTAGALQSGSQSAAPGDGGSGDAGSGGSLLEQIVDGIREFGEGLQEGRGRFEKQQGVVDDLFWNQDLANRAFNAGKQEVLIDGQYYSCDVLSADHRHLEGFDLGPGYEDYKLSWARLWVSDEDTGFYEPIAMSATIVSPEGEYMTMYRTHKDFTQEGPDGMIVPRRTTLTMQGIGGLIQGAIADVWTEVQTIHEVLVNDGAPTAEESATLIADAMERLGL